MGGGCLQDIPQGRHEGVDAAAQVLEVHEECIEGVHHGGRGPPHLPVETEDREAMDRIHEVRGFHHVVLLVPTQSVLGAEGCGELEILQARQGVQGVVKPLRDGGGMGQQRHPAPFQRPAQLRIGQETVEAGPHSSTQGGRIRVKEVARWKSGLAPVWWRAQ